VSLRVSVQRMTRPHPHALLIVVALGAVEACAPIRHERLDDIWGLTEIMRAAVCAEPDRVAKLVACGSNVDARGREGETALMYAAGREVNVWTCSRGPRLCPARQFDQLEDERTRVEIVERLLAASASVGLVDSIGRTAVWYAVHKDHASIVDALLRAGSDPNEGSGELLGLAAVGKSNTLRALLINGADPNARAPGGMTALMVASNCVYGNTENVAVLLEHGADAEAQNEDGTAWVFARRRGNVEVLRLLEAAGARRYSHWPPLASTK